MNQGNLIFISLSPPVPVSALYWISFREIQSRALTSSL